MRQGHSSGLTKEHVNGSYSLGRRSDIELTTYIFIQDQGKWCGYPKDHPDCQVHEESFQELQLKLHQLRLDLSRSASCCSNTALLCWHWQREISRIRNEE